MRRVTCLLLAAAAVSALSAAPDARARQGSSPPLRSSIAGKDLGKALANPGVDIYFWSPGAFTLLGHVDATREVFYTPGAAPAAVIQNTKGCGATYASLQKWCPFPITAKVLKCSRPPDASPETRTADDPPLEEAQNRQLNSAPPMQALQPEQLVLVRAGDSRDFLKALATEPWNANGECKDPKSDDAGTAHWGDSLMFDGSSGTLRLTVVNAVAETSSEGGSLLTNPWVDTAIAGGIAGGVYAGVHGSDSSTPTTPGGTTGVPDESTRVNQTFPITVTFSPSSSCFANGTATLIISGTATSTTVKFGGQLASFPMVTGQVTAGSSAYTFTGAATGTNPTTGGTIGVNVTLTFSFTSTGVSGSATVASSCGTATVSIINA